MSDELVPMTEWIANIRSEASRRRVVIAVVFALVALLALIAGVFWPKKYHASTTILVQQNNIIKPLTEGLATPTAAADRASIAREVIFSRTVMEQILTVGGWMASHPTPLEQANLITDITNRTSVATPRENLLEINYTDSDPERAFKVTQGLARLFIEESLASKERESTSAYEFMDNQVQEYHRKLDEAGAKIAQFIEQHPGTSPGDQVDNKTRVAQLRSGIETARMNVAELGSQSATLGGQLSGQSEVATVQTREGLYRSQIAGLQGQLDKLLLTYTNDYPDVVRTRHQIEDLRQQMASAEQQKNSATAAGTALDNTIQFNPVYQQLQTQQASVRGNLAAAQARLNIGTVQLQEELTRSQTAAASEATVSKLTSDFNTLQTIYQELLKRRENARVSMDLDREHRGLSFRIQDPAMVPLVPSGLRLHHFAIAGVLLAILLPLVLLFGVARFDPRVRSGEQLERITGLPVLATIPRYHTTQVAQNDRNRSLLAALIVVGALACYVLLYLLRMTKTI